MKESDTDKDLPGRDDSPELRGVFEAALEISRRRGETLRRLREALLADNTDEVLALARQHCGIEDKKTDA